MQSPISYQLIDSGNGKKLEKFGTYTLSRPSLQAVWECEKSENIWEQAHAVFTREGEKGGWKWKGKAPESWVVELQGLKFKLLPTDFGHVGIFPEHSLLWPRFETLLKKKQKPEVLNLFAYSGGATLACAKSGANVCHLDASKGMVAWARENAALNKMEEMPIRWIIDDALKFIQREKRRGKKYDAVILDPPSFGRGAKGEVFKIEEHLIPLMKEIRSILSDEPLFIALSCHTPGYTPLSLGHLLKQVLKGMKGSIDTFEMMIPGPCDLPSGSCAIWSFE